MTTETLFFAIYISSDSIPDNVSGISIGFELFREHRDRASESGWIFHGKHEILETESRWIAAAEKSGA